MKTPVAFIIFRRPQTTEKVFEAIRQAKPSKLLVIADGPRPNVHGEAEKCYTTREIIKRVDWDCEVLTNFSDTNLGCKLRVSSGLDWVFKNVEEAIILEDDCLPHPTFFNFCEELLNKYRDDKRIMVISGNNFQFGQIRNQDDYYFSRYNHCWGWATWKRAWQLFDIEMKLWPKVFKEGWLQDILKNPQSVKYWAKNFQSVYEGKIDTWDYIWVYSCWLQNSLAILPNRNLVSNIGFYSEATHSKDANSICANIPVKGIEFPLKHPDFIIRNERADYFAQNILYEPKFTFNIYRKLKLIFKKFKNNFL
ncbi:hemolytic protein HlpA-like protein [Calothrix sp. HK-06]|nr:hemolytic protein HlpA-like protein [Calothrix sp. HK-06]